MEKTSTYFDVPVKKNMEKTSTYFDVLVKKDMNDGRDDLLEIVESFVISTEEEEYKGQTIYNGCVSFKKDDGIYEKQYHTCEFTRESAEFYCWNWIFSNYKKA